MKSVYFEVSYRNYLDNAKITDNVRDIVHREIFVILFDHIVNRRSIILFEIKTINILNKNLK
jgi:hypothetical protein